MASPGIPSPPAGAEGCSLGHLVVAWLGVCVCPSSLANSLLDGKRYFRKKGIGGLRLPVACDSTMRFLSRIDKRWLASFQARSSRPKPADTQPICTNCTITSAKKKAYQAWITSCWESFPRVNHPPFPTKAWFALPAQAQPQQ